MEKSAEKWGPGGRRRPPVGVQGAMPLVGGQGALAEAFLTKNKM